MQLPHLNISKLQCIIFLWYRFGFISPHAIFIILIKYLSYKVQIVIMDNLAIFVLSCHYK